MALLLGACGTVWADVEILTAELPRAVAGANYQGAIRTVSTSGCTNTDVALAARPGDLPEGLDIRGDAIGAFRVSWAHTG